MDPQVENQERPSHQQLNLKAWLTLVRSGLAMALGLAILFVPNKSLGMLTNMIGTFWLGASIVHVRQAALQRNGRPWALIIGYFGIVAGASVILRHWIDNWVPVEILSTLLGLTAIATGALHLSGSLRVRQTGRPVRNWSTVMIGVFEIGLGLVLLISTNVTESIWLALLAIGWAFVGGLTMLLDGLELRREAWLRAVEEAYPVEPPAVTGSAAQPDPPSSLA